MFTGIIEAIGKVVSTTSTDMGLVLEVAPPNDWISELYPDQSIAHNGVCLTVTSVSSSSYFVTAIAETLSKTNLASLATGSHINLERALKLGDRLDGHLVQGHVDTTATCISIHQESDSSHVLQFQIDPAFGAYLVEKGSATINGISLTVFNLTAHSFTVAIIPYTWEHTTIAELQVGSIVNIEFDIAGKYFLRHLQLS